MIYIVNISDRDYLRSIPRDSSASGREHPLVRRVIDEVYEYEKRGYYQFRMPVEKQGKISSDMSVSTTSSTSHQMSLGEGQRSSLQIPSSQLDGLMLSQTISTVPSNVLVDASESSKVGDDDSIDGKSVDSSVLDVVDEKLQVPVSDTENPIRGDIFKPSLVLCSSLKFEAKVAQLKTDPDVSLWKEFIESNPWHRSMISKLVDETFRSLGNFLLLLFLFVISLLSGLIRFYTMSVPTSESRVWVIRRGFTTPDCAAIVNTNLSRYGPCH